MKLLLKIKNGTPPMRKAAMRQITDKAREFGAAALFNQILPLLMSPTLEDQARDLMTHVARAVFASQLVLIARVVTVGGLVAVYVTLYFSFSNDE